MKLQKRRILSMLLALVLAAGFSVPALAADTAQTGASPEIQVQVGEERVSFGAAGPMVVNGRIYVPDDSVFSVLGAGYTYDPETKTATAVRGDRTVCFTAGQPFMTVTQKGETTTVETGAPPFLKDGHFMIPVRYAAAALGCNVGWDAFWKSVLILDVDGILDGMSFTIMDQYLAYSRKLEQTPYSFSGSFTLSTNALYGVPIVSQGNITGLADSSAINMDLTVNTDLKDLMDALSAFGASEESLSELNKLKNIRISYILNLAENKLYLQSPLLSQVMGIETDAWLSLDLGSLSALYGSNLAMTIPSSAAASQSDSMRDFLEAYLTSIPLTAAEDLSSIRETLSAIYSFIGDGAFVNNGGTYVSRQTIDSDGMIGDFKLVLNRKGTAVNGCSLTLNLQDAEGAGSIQLGYTMDERYKTILDLNCDLGEELQMAFHMVMRYTATNQTPKPAPGDGSTVIPFE